MTNESSVVIRISKNEMDFEDVPATMVIEEGLLYLHVKSLSADIAIPTSEIASHFSEILSRYGVE